MSDFETRSRAAMMRDMISTQVEFLPLPGSPAPATQADATPPKLVTAREAAKVLGVCEKTLWSIANRGEISVVRIGRRVCYDQNDLHRFIESKKATGGTSSATASARVV
jgi:excisionase family DNA binding protein